MPLRPSRLVRAALSCNSQVPAHRGEGAQAVQVGEGVVVVDLQVLAHRGEAAQAVQVGEGVVVHDRILCKSPPTEVRQINSLKSVHEGQSIVRSPEIEVYPARVATSDCVVIVKSPLYSPRVQSDQCRYPCRYPYPCRYRYPYRCPCRSPYRYRIGVRVGISRSTVAARRAVRAPAANQHGRQDHQKQVSHSPAFILYMRSSYH